jgi:hypothetical protein
LGQRFEPGWSEARTLHRWTKSRLAWQPPCHGINRPPKEMFRAMADFVTLRGLWCRPHQTITG